MNLTRFWKKTRRLAVHHFLIELLLIATFLSFSFYPGSLGDLMRLGYIILLAHFLDRAYKPSAMTGGHIALAGVLIVLVVLSLTGKPELVHSRSLSYLLSMPSIIVLIHILAVRQPSPDWRLLKHLVLSVVALSITGQILAHHIPAWGGNHGFYPNLHHLGFFASLVIPILLFLLAESTTGGRLAAGVAVLGAFYLLWESTSRISWLVFLVSILLTIVIFLDKKQIWIALAALMLISVLTALLSGEDAIQARLRDFMGNWRAEERIYLWSDTVAMLKSNTVIEWLCGHGIGSFRYFFKDFEGLTAQHVQLAYSFPHNIFLQVLFENGLIGAAAVFSSLSCFVYFLWRGARTHLKNSPIRNLYILCFTVFWIIFLHCSLTKSMYSKYIIYAFSIIAGIGLVLFEKSGLTAAVSTRWRPADK